PAVHAGGRRLLLERTLPRPDPRRPRPCRPARRSHDRPGGPRARRWKSATPELRREWIAALDTIESLHPRAVIAGHKRPGRDDDPRIIEETRQYIRAFDRIAETTTTARELYDQMLSLYPDRVTPGALWSSARALTS